ncbi:XrtA/PEP-CTERM system histidine kinase PrsK [Qipengyuania sp. JC766]|uniref:XrtA/PEP-CTERM system histidine kinase PrsK n=1 Tax=Qipengyuania sp. JC766 TaxID=3232139 RepID=UPI00345A8017
MATIEFAVMVGAGIGCTLAAAWIVRHGERRRTDRWLAVVALGLTAVWSLLHAALGPDTRASGLTEIARNLAWFALLYAMFANDGRHASLRPVRPVILALVFVELLQLALMAIETRMAVGPDQIAMALQVSALFRILVAVGVLVCLHNLLVGASLTLQQAMRWTVAGTGIFWTVELNAHLLAYVGGPSVADLALVRGVVAGLVAILLAFGATQASRSMTLQPSRRVTFQSLSVFVLGAYLFAMVAGARALSWVGGEWSVVLQTGFVFLACSAALLVLPSRSLRNRLRVTVTKHLFRHRYDYRTEWLRFNETIAIGDEPGRPLEVRAVKALADITESPGGILLLPDEEGRFRYAAEWGWPQAEVPSDPIPEGTALSMAQQSFVFDLDALRGLPGGEEFELPEWLIDLPKAWALVPLLNSEKLAGIVILARPPVARRLDWEDFDLLRVAGRQIAIHLAEQSSQEALMEAGRFDDFSRRIAFVMHDIKNLASQLSLLSRNAEKHADNPEFRADMLVTLRSSSEKLNGLLSRLGRYGSGKGEPCQSIDLARLAQDVAERMRGLHPLSVVPSGPVLIEGQKAALDQAITHLVQNAIEASQPNVPVQLCVSDDGIRGVLEIIDAGTGMSAQFVRTNLFRPFTTSKENGFGIGAYEARELVRAMGGRVDVESKEGLGSRFSISFPLSSVADVFGSGTAQMSKVA